MAPDPSAPAATDPQAKQHFDRADTLSGEAALAEYDRALAIDPRFSAAWSDKGHVLFTLRRFDEALACQERAIALTPTLVTAWSNKSACLVELGRPAEALEAAVRATELAPKNPAPWLNRARCEALLGRTPAAIATYEHVVSLGLDPKALGEVRGRITALRGATRTVDQWIAESVRLGREDDLQGSMAALDHALELDPCAWAAWSNKAVNAAKAGMLLDALAYARHATALAPPGSSTHALERRVEEALRATPSTVRAALPPGRFGRPMKERAQRGDPAAAFAIEALQALIARGLVDPDELAGASYHLLLPGGRELPVDALTDSRVGFFFRGDDTLFPEDLLAIVTLILDERLARAVVVARKAWSANVRSLVAQADAQIASVQGPTRRVLLEVVGGS